MLRAAILFTLLGCSLALRGTKRTVNPPSNVKVRPSEHVCKEKPAGVHTAGVVDSVNSEFCNSNALHMSPKKQGIRLEHVRGISRTLFGNSDWPTKQLTKRWTNHVTGGHDGNSTPNERSWDSQDKKSVSQSSNQHKKNHLICQGELLLWLEEGLRGTRKTNKQLINHIIKLGKSERMPVKKIKKSKGLKPKDKSVPDIQDFLTNFTIFW